MSDLRINDIADAAKGLQVGLNKGIYTEEDRKRILQVRDKMVDCVRSYISAFVPQESDDPKPVEQKRKFVKVDNG